MYESQRFTKNVGPFHYNLADTKLKTRQMEKKLRTAQWLVSDAAMCTYSHGNFKPNHSVHYFVKLWVAECLCKWNSLVTVLFDEGMANLWKIN